MEEETKTYYLFGTTDENVWQGTARGFDAYKSSDLENWSGPFPVFHPTPDFWADRNFWAPEVYFYQNRYYMFASFKAEGECRGTQILIAADPLGPYRTLRDEPITPREWECLDGTLYLDDKQEPWIIFCREWTQVHDGEIWAQRLTADLVNTAGEPTLLFRASEAIWTVPVRNETDFVTDGPFLYVNQIGELLMLWSSRSEKGYAVGIARSVTGLVTGPWIQDSEPLLDEDGGHAMMFRTFSGKCKIAVHSPNKSPHERPVFLSVIEQGGNLIVM